MAAPSAVSLALCMALYCTAQHMTVQQVDATAAANGVVAVRDTSMVASVLLPLKHISEGSPMRNPPRVTARPYGSAACAASSGPPNAMAANDPAKMVPQAM